MNPPSFPRLAVLMFGMFVMAMATMPAIADELYSVVLTKTSEDAPAPVTITIPEGKALEVVTFIHQTDNGAAAAVSLNGLGLAQSSASSFSYLDVKQMPQIAGPVTLTLAFPSPPPTIGNGCLLTYKLKDATATPGSVTNPSAGAAVVIPSDSVGPVQIILESSTDLITWTAASPGSYGASTTKRFFRVRAVNQ